MVDSLVNSCIPNFMKVRLRGPNKVLTNISELTAAEGFNG